ncbi:MAG: DMT family transporter [Arenibacterium sp.]
MTANTKAALFMMASMAAFTLNDACVKLAGGDLPLFQLITLRGILASLLIYLLARYMNALRFRMNRADAMLVATRAAMEAAATYFFLTALMNMPLANVTAVLQVLPLTVTLGAALVFGEQVGWRRMLAIAMGFCGMLLIVRPGPDGFNLFAAYALAAVLCVTIRDLVTRRISNAVPSLTVTLISSLAVLSFGAIAATGDTWVALDVPVALLLVAAAVFIIGGYVFSILVMRAGEVSFSAPFRYTGLGWALVLGWLVFGDWPDQITLLGAAIVVASGLFALYRERVKGQGAG